MTRRDICRSEATRELGYFGRLRRNYSRESRLLSTLRRSRPSTDVAAGTPERRGPAGGCRRAGWTVVTRSYVVTLMSISAALTLCGSQAEQARASTATATETGADQVKKHEAYERLLDRAGEEGVVLSFHRAADTGELHLTLDDAELERDLDFGSPPAADPVLTQALALLRRGDTFVVRFVKKSDRSFFVPLESPAYLDFAAIALAHTHAAARRIQE